MEKRSRDKWRREKESREKRKREKREREEEGGRREKGGRRKEEGGGKKVGEDECSRTSYMLQGSSFSTYIRYVENSRQNRLLQSSIL